MTAAAPFGGHVHANGIRQHYLHFAGPGAPLVVLPGITSPAMTWAFVGSRLAQAFDVYVLDARGRGLSSTGPGLDYGLDALADDASAFVAALGLRDAVMVGHSMGARTAIRAAARRPRGFARLVLVDPPVSGPGRRPYPADLDWYVDSIRLAGAGMDAEAMRRFCPSWTHEQRALRAEWLHTCYEPAVVTAFEGFHADDVHTDLPKIDLPADLVVAGRGGVILSEDEAELLQLKPGMRSVRVANAGHMIPWDDLEGFLSAVDDLLGTSLAEERAAA